MANVIRPGDDELVSVDYSHLLENILRVLRSQQTKNLFSISDDCPSDTLRDRNRLLIDIDAIADRVANSQVQNPLGASERRAHSATVNFTPAFKASFPGKVREIRDCLRQLLESALGQNASIEEFVRSLVTPLETLSGSVTRLGFTYDFGKQYQRLQKQKLTLDSNRSDSNSDLKFHKLTITVRNTREFDTHLREGLENHINSFDISESEQEQLKDILQDMEADELSDFHQLKRIVDTETLGKLKKEAKITYLEYLLANIRSSSGTPDPFAVIYLQDLIRRLRLIEEYISNVERADSDYEVNYAGRTVNYKDLFSRSEVLDALPIIPIVAGNLGETTDNNQGDRQFIFGLKLKLAGSVQAYGGRSSFEYHLNLLNPDSQELEPELASNHNFPEKVLKLAFLYFFVFASRSSPRAKNYNPNSELEYDPISVFETKVLPILQGSDEEQKKTVFKGIKKGLEQFHVSEKIQKLRELLKNFLDRQTTLPTRTYPLHISVRRGILEGDINNITSGIFFNDVLLRNTREALRYISIGQQSVEARALCQLPASITIEDIRYFTAEARQEFSMNYNIKHIKALPILWTPKNERCNRYFQQNKLVVFSYDNRRLGPNGLDSNKAFVYRFTFSLLAYICIKILLENAQNNLFIPMVRLHLGNNENPSPSEEFTAALSKVLSHLFKEKHLSSSQGFRIRQEPDTFKIRNGLSSLYSVLPKKFRFTDANSTPNLDKLAIIVVSSRESDASRSNQNRFRRRANLMGEVVSCKRIEDRTIQLETLQTFSDNYGVRRLYSEPTVLRDTVNNLYQQGYRHFLYIAQAPYSSTLHITTSEQDEGLYFMSPTLISFLKSEHPDIKIYPVFFDKYGSCVPSMLNMQGKCQNNKARISKLIKFLKARATAFQ